MQALPEGNHLWKSALASGIVTAVLGVLVLVWPNASILAAAILFGAYLVVSGITQVALAFGLPVSSVSGRVLMFISGAASLVLAVLCFRSIGNSIMLLAIWIGVGFVLRGVAEVVAGISDSSLPARGWVIVSGVLSILAGFVLLAYPFPSLQVLALVTAAFLILLGVSEVVAAVRLRQPTKTVVDS